ncbi:LPS translocon maturation chaperone LptM [Actimicrobium sp. CCI2.3]|uniref:LPS translocon maturation chaperone LptM n=1 Tax=Actimicrobium sp. CCI2.3 TaxID=3048616 RepID=UPI002AB34A06|nr:lipoprotein [Actimicrobium sp. CCI2.3]MDY7573328.1 lipoprotein [Actimicrobium sp. CCI2.3]MEB0021725.1 lipoprotein [Actimicrobium sp. CCI2.3]
MKHSSLLHHLFFSALILTGGIVLGGCGQRGPLTLPVRPTAISTTPTPPAPSIKPPAPATEPSSK